MKSDDRIRYASVCDMDGKELGMQIRDGVNRMLNDEEHKLALSFAVNHMKERVKLSPKLGKTQYVFTAYDNLDRLTMPIGDNYVLLITWAPQGATLDIFRHIQKALQT